MQKHEIIIKKILTRLLEQRYTSGKDMPLEELWSNNINKEEYNRVKNFLLPDDAKHLVGICAPRNEPVRITITAQGVAYLERLEQKEANETMRDIQKATAKTQIFMVAATSILAFFSMVEILQKAITFKSIYLAVILSLIIIVFFLWAWYFSERKDWHKKF